jgi:hypothetical protein
MKRLTEQQKIELATLEKRVDALKAIEAVAIENMLQRVEEVFVRTHPVYLKNGLDVREMSIGNESDVVTIIKLRHMFEKDPYTIYEILKEFFQK